MNSRQSQILVRPLLNEKAASLSAIGKYTFQVANDANKIEITHAVNQLLKDQKKKGKVVAVNTLMIRDSRRRYKSRLRVPQDSKKAIVTIDGEGFDFYSA
jgi:large subunit ribosomal protein L23